MALGLLLVCGACLWLGLRWKRAARLGKLRPRGVAREDVTSPAALFTSRLLSKKKDSKGDCVGTWDRLPKPKKKKTKQTARGQATLLLRFTIHAHTFAVYGLACDDGSCHLARALNTDKKKSEERKRKKKKQGKAKKE